MRSSIISLNFKKMIFSFLTFLIQGQIELNLTSIKQHSKIHLDEKNIYNSAIQKCDAIKQYEFEFEKNDF